MDGKKPPIGTFLATEDYPNFELGGKREWGRRSLELTRDVGGICLMGFSPGEYNVICVG